MYNVVFRLRLWFRSPFPVNTNPKYIMSNYREPVYFTAEMFIDIYVSCKVALGLINHYVVLDLKVCLVQVEQYVRMEFLKYINFFLAHTLSKKFLSEVLHIVWILPINGYS